jgi:hypothetical protein
VEPCARLVWVTRRVVDDVGQFRIGVHDIESLAIWEGQGCVVSLSSLLVELDMHQKARGVVTQDHHEPLLAPPPSTASGEMVALVAPALSEERE